MRVKKKSKRGKGEFSVLLCYYESLIGVIMQVQAAMFWWPLTLSAYLIRLVTAAEEWKTAPSLPAASLTFR